MIDWERELEEIFEDPLFDDVKPAKKRITSSDRLIAGFQQVLDFYECNVRLPEDKGVERKLYHMWKGIISSEKKIAKCQPFDTCGILPIEESSVHEATMDYKVPAEEDELEAILNDPLLSEIEDGTDLDLFNIPNYMRERLNARKEAEYVGKRKPCEDFEKFEPLFKDIHVGLKSGKYRLVKFSVTNLKVGNYFVEDGVIGYLAAFDDEGINKHGDRDGRTRVIYENGTESDIKYKTITKNLSVTGYSIQDCSDVTTEELDKSLQVNNDDVESGTIYVLRSKSKRPEIADIRNLYKIGFTVTSIESRIANAKNEPTYLCADVEVVASWRVYNVKTSTLEALIHKLFSSVQLQVTIDGQRPKEWFVVPLNIIEQAITDIINGMPIQYDRNLQELIKL